MASDSLSNIVIPMPSKWGTISMKSWLPKIPTTPSGHFNAFIRLDIRIIVSSKTPYVSKR